MKRALLIASVLVASGCQKDYRWRGVDVSSGQEISLAPSRLPSSHSFTGAYYSAWLGDLKLVQESRIVLGSYDVERGGCKVHGDLHGRVQDNLLTYSWEEDHSRCGREQPVTGRGYVLYRSEPSPPRLFGRWGYAWSERQGGAWIAEKLSDERPGLD